MMMSSLPPPEQNTKLIRNVADVIPHILEYLLKHPNIAHTARGIAVGLKMNTVTVSRAIVIIKTVQDLLLQENYKITVKSLNNNTTNLKPKSGKYYYNKDIIILEEKNERKVLDSL